MDNERRRAWRGRRVLVTGHTGFKGAWLRQWLEHLGVDVAGLAPATTPNLHDLLGLQMPADETVDVLDAPAVADRIDAFHPKVIFHLAAQRLVRRSFAEPVQTFATNVLGTANVLEAVRVSGGVRVVVVVTSDKVYEPCSDGAPHDESSPLGGADPYSASKAATEHVVVAYRRGMRLGDEGVALVAARAGNVIGGGDWAPDRIVTDVVDALASGERVRLRYPEAVRPWQHVLDPLAGYLRYAGVLLADQGAAPPALNFGPSDESGSTVAELVDGLSARLGGRPGWRADPQPSPPETHALRLSAELARTRIGWTPRLDLEESLDLTARWHDEFRRGDDVRSETVAEIESYEGRA